MGRPPNILWIVTTQWRAQATGCAGDPNLLTRDGRSRTPHIDALARDPHTINFTQAVTPHPFGPFARAALLTGIPSPENGVRDYFDPLPENTRTLAHELREHHNYTASFFGKWHLANRDPHAPLTGEMHARTIVPPEARGGFDFWEGFESGFLLNNPWLHGTRLPAPRQFHGYQSDILCKRALDYLHANGGQAAPQFCVVSLEAPHPPYAAPTPKIAALTSGQITLPANVPPGSEIETQTRRELAGYYAHIEATDAAIGRLIAGVRAREHTRDTLIAFTSVHGDMHGAHGLFRKGWPHEESVRVPLLVNHKSLNHEKNNSAVSLVNLREMMRDHIAGTGAREARPCARISMPSVVRLPHQCDRTWRGIRTRTRKLILNEDRSPWLFFDLENDPLEMRNLAGDASRAGEIAKFRTLI